MSRRSGWVGVPVVLVSSPTLRRHGVKFHEVVLLSFDQCACGELTSCLVRLRPYEKTEHPETILLDCLLFEYLVHVLEMLCGERYAERSENVTQGGMFIGVKTPFSESLSTFTELKRSPLACWSLRTVETAEPNSVISVQVQYMPLNAEILLIMKDLDSMVKDAMQYKWVMPGTFVMLSLTSKEYMVAVIIISINKSKEKIAYRIGTCETFSVVSSMTSLSNRHFFDMTSTKDHLDAYKTLCFGYDALVDSILQLVAVKGPSSPSGVLLEGCAGVGKSSLLSFLRGILQAEWHVHHISVKDLLLLATLSSEETLLKTLLPVEPSPQVILLIDDLDVLHIGPTTSHFQTLSELDQEKRLVLNCVLQTIDRLSEHGSMTIAAGQSITGLPLSLSKAGRLERVIKMNPPTQTQREFILMDFLCRSYDEATCRKWSERLATITGGCVARDLHRLAVDASADVITSEKAPTWDNWKIAAQKCSPSQLAFLDVKKPCIFLEESITKDWLEIHNHSWRTFIGYPLLKARIYRTIVVPWRRHLSRDRVDLPALGALAPPPGVLFHGKSGCGKTLAASCLGSSLGLPMVKVRAMDVLDKWLGGSEEIIRQLFAKARAAAPCILFLDEIDAIASDRGTRSESTDVMSRLLSTILNEMDGISSVSEDNVLVVACTNRVNSLDKALLRPGRLEEHIEVHTPTVADALEILQWQFTTVSLEEGLDLNSIAEFLCRRNASAADLEGVARESVFRSLDRQDNTKQTLLLTQSDVTEAIYALKLK